MELETFGLNSNLLNSEQVNSNIQNKSLTRSYEEILENELRRANPVLKGHTNEVCSLALTSDECRLISCGKDNTLRVWSLIDRTQLETFEIEVDASESLSKLCLSADDKNVVLLVSQKSLLVWNFHRRASTAKVPERQNVLIHSVSISSDSSHFCTSDSEKAVKVFDLNGNLLKTLQLEDFELTFVIFTLKVVLFGDSSGKISAWNTLTSNVDFALDRGSGKPRTGAVFENNSLLAAGYEDSEVVVWDLVKREQKYRTFTGLGSITGVSVSGRNSEYSIVFITTNNTLGFLDPAAGVVENIYVRHSDTTNDVLQTSDGKLVITGAADRLIKVWQKKEYRDFKSPFNLGKQVISTALSQSAETLVVLNNSSSFKLFNIAENTEKLSLSNKADEVYTAIWTHDQSEVITSNRTPEIAVFSYEHKSLEFSIPCETSIKSLALSPDSHLLYGCGGTFKIFAWNLRLRVLDYVLESQGDNHVVVLTQMNKLLAAGDDVINVWNLETRSIEASLEATSTFKCLVALSDGRTVISGGTDSKIRFWDLQEKLCEEVLDEEYHRALVMHLADHEKTLVVLHDSAKVTVVDVGARRIRYEFEAPLPSSSCTALDDNVLIICDSEFVRFWNLKENNEEASFKAHSEAINSVLIDSEKKVLITVSADKTIKSWRISDRAEEESFQAFNGIFSTVCLSDQYVGIGTATGEVVIYSISTSKRLTSLKVHESNIRCIACSDKLFVTGSEDCKVCLFDIDTRTPCYLEGHTNWVLSVKFSYDSRLVFSGCCNSSIKAWNVEKKTLEYQFETQDNGIMSLLAFMDGKLLVCGTGDYSVKFWNLKTKKVDFSLKHHSAAVTSLAANEDESFVFSGAEDFKIAVIDVRRKKVVSFLYGHCNSIEYLAVHNDVLYSSDCARIKTWLLKQNKEVFSFCWREDVPQQLALSPDQQYLAASFDTGAVRVFDFHQDKFLETFYPLGSKVAKLSFSPDSRSLVLSGEDSSILIWNIEQRQSQKVSKIKNHCKNLVFSNDFALLSTLANDSTICVWDWANHKKICSFEEVSSGVELMIFSDHRFLITASDDGNVVKWDLETKESQTFKVHDSKITGLARSSTRDMLVSASHDRCVSFFDLVKNELIVKQETHSEPITAFAITKDEKFGISAGNDSVLIIWDLDSKEESFRLKSSSINITDIVVSPDNEHFYISSEDKSILKWSLKQKKIVKYLGTFGGEVSSIVLNNDGSRVYVGTFSNTINVFNIQTRTELACLPCHSDTIFELALSDDESLLASASTDLSIKVFDAETYDEIAHFENAASDWIRSICITKDNKFLIIGSDGNLITFWNLQSKAKEFVLEGHKKLVYCVRLTSDNKFLLSSSQDETIKLWDIQSRSLVHSFTGHFLDVYILEIFKTKPSFASGGDDTLIKVWSIQDQREEFTLHGHSEALVCLKLTPDELRLISGANDKKIIVWDLQKQMIELCLSSHDSAINALNITNNGNFLITSGEDSVLKVWKMIEPQVVKDMSYSQKPYVKVKTPDGRFELNYHYGSLSDVYENNSDMNKLPFGITDVFDPYYQNLIWFYNLVDNIKEDLYDTLVPETSNIVFSRFLYTSLHILGFKGHSKRLEDLIGAENCQFKCDYFRKSPLYYALVKGHQDCVVLLIDFLIKLSSSKDKTQVHSSLTSISEELPLIIKNSSKRLHILLKGCLISTSPTFISISQNLPVYHFNKSFLPTPSEFIKAETPVNESSQVILKYTAFKLPWKEGSEESLKLLEAIIDCSNSNIYNTQIIQYFIQIQWEALIYWVLSYTLLLWLNIVLLVLLFTFEDITSTWMLPAYLFVNFLLMFWESVQMFIEGFIEYFREPWNIIDFFRFIISMVWVTMSLLTFNKGVEFRILTWTAALFNFARGVTGFRLFDGTRYYVRLILRALGDMGYFIVMLSYSTLTFGVLFQVSRQNEPLDFKTLWMDSYSLNFGNFNAQDDYKFSFETLAYMLATVVNVILMLNLLISILGDSYSNFQTEKVFIDYSEKASIVLEIQKMLFWVDRVADKQYLHVLTSSTAGDDQGTVDEKIENIETGLGNLHELVRSQSGHSKDEICIQIQKLDEKVQEKIHLVEKKIEGIEGKIQGFEGKFSEVNSTLNQILGLLQPKQD